MTISPDLIKALRTKTGAGIMDVKKALSEANGDESKALEIIRKKGQDKAAKKSGREVREGIIISYIHGGGKIGALVEMNCETDFVARNKDFQALAKEIAMQVVATDPQYISVDDVPESVKEKEIEIIKEQLAKEGKPEQVMAKIIEGKMEKFFDGACLLRNKYFRDDSQTIEDLLNQAVGKIGENIKIGKITRFSLGQ